MDVIVELWGPLSDSRSYTWIPVGKIDASSLDIDYLKKETMKIVESLEWKKQMDAEGVRFPLANMARLRVTRNGKDEMKITLEDLS